MKNSADNLLREHLVRLLKEGNAHLTFDAAVADFPAKLRGKRVQGLPHTAWMLVEHLRIAQWDILEFSRNPRHVSPEWPKGYWPTSAAPRNQKEWNDSLRSFANDRRAIERLVNNRKTDLFAPLTWGGGQTILREVLLVADHNAYHVGQLVHLRRLLGAWGA